MFSIFNRWDAASYLIFAASLLSFMISLALSLTEIVLSMRALEVELGDMEELTRTNLFKDIINRNP